MPGPRLDAQVPAGAAPRAIAPSEDSCSTVAYQTRDFRCESRVLEPPWSDSAPRPRPRRVRIVDHLRTQCVLRAQMDRFLIRPRGGGGNGGSRDLGGGSGVGGGTAGGHHHPGHSDGGGSRKGMEARRHLDLDAVSTTSGSVQGMKVWSLTQFYSVDFSKSRIYVKKCVFNKRTIKVCVSCC